jgi:DNA-directed RNA polymerase subunit RPC12/RpoP
MARGMRFVCENCSTTIEAWDDGNPYYFDADGKKEYAYHPEPKLQLCVGNDAPHLCLECGTHVMVDSQAPDTHCVQCGSGNIVDLFRLEGHRCPACKLGVFTLDPHFVAIS